MNENKVLLEMNAIAILYNQAKPIPSNGGFREVAKLKLIEF